MPSATLETIFGIFGLISLFVSAGVFTRASVTKATMTELRQTNTDLRTRNGDLLAHIKDMTAACTEIKDKLSSEIAKRELLQDMATGRSDIARLIDLLEARTQFFVDIEAKLDTILQAVITP